LGNSATKTLDVDAKQAVRYCIEEWLRDEQIALAIKRPEVGRIEEHPVRDDECAIVCYGPSLAKTLEDVRAFRWIFTCSGSHRYLIDRGTVPTWHVEVDPRKHKIDLLGEPHRDVTYLPASCCHPLYFDHLAKHGATTKIWHVYDTAEESMRKLPMGEWSITGGSNVGLRAMTIARFFGFKKMHVFGMDGCEGEEVGKKHAGPHILQDGTPHMMCEYPKGSGRMWRTTPGLLESARQTFHELDMMADVSCTFHGDGLVQEMHKAYVPNPKKAKDGKGVLIAIQKPELISADYRDMNTQLHRENLAYGVGGGKYAPTVRKLAESMKTTSILDYGCGKGYLAKELPFPIWEYDPAIPEKAESPRPADLVVCTDVLEHIEPDLLEFVLADIRRCTKKVGFFVIHTGPAGKTLPDGRNSHLIQQPMPWWKDRLKRHFKIGQLFERAPLVFAVVGPK
jgi:hypothetical protein